MSSKKRCSCLILSGFLGLPIGYFPTPLASLLSPQSRGLMQLKQGVRLRNLQSQTALAMQVVNSVYTKHLYELVVTSVSDGIHKANSKHYEGLAFDCRTRDLSTRALIDIVNDVRDALGKDFDVMLEKDHLHVEYDPKII